MLPTDRRGGAKGLDKVPERTQFDDQDPAPGGRRRRWDPARPARCQGVEIDKFREILEGPENRSVFLKLGRAYAVQKTFDKPVRLHHGRGLSETERPAPCDREPGM